MNIYSSQTNVTCYILVLSIVLFSLSSRAHTQDKSGNDLAQHNAKFHGIGSHPDYPSFEKNLICPDGELTEQEANLYQASLPTGSEISSQRERLANLLNDHDIGSVAPAPEVRESLVELGRFLAFDKILSGARDISCMSCHHPNTFTGDERMLGFGARGHSTPEAKERGRIALGLRKNEANDFSDNMLSIGTNRTGELATVVSRHTPPLYNLHAYDNLFWDGRIEYKVATEASIGPLYARDSNQVMRRVRNITIDGYLDNTEIQIFSEYRSKGGLVNPIFKDNLLVDSDIDVAENENEIKFPFEIEILKENSTLYEISTSHNEELNGLLETLEFGIVSALPLFPVLSHVEMIGENSSGYEYPTDGSCPSAEKNGIAAKASLSGNPTLNVWSALVERLRCEAPLYLDYFIQAYPNIESWQNINAGHIANAIAGYMLDEFYSVETPLSEFKSGVENNLAYQENTALTRGQVLGGIRFIEVGCVNCHSGPLLSDFEFHNTGLAQIGPGKLDDIQTMTTLITPESSLSANGGSNFFTGDLGRKHHDATAKPFTFRTSPLINVTETWSGGHAGQYLKLDDFIEHYRDPITAYVNYGQCFSGPANAQVGGATKSGSDNYGFAATNGVGSEILAMHWGTAGNYNDHNPHDDEIITGLDEQVKSLANGATGNSMTRQDVQSIAQFLNALTSKEVCNNAWPTTENGKRDFSNDPRNVNDPYYKYQQPVINAPIMKRVKSSGSSTDGTTILFERNGVKDIPRILKKNNSYDYIDLSHPLSGLPVDWFYRVACAAN